MSYQFTKLSSLHQWWLIRKYYAIYKGSKIYTIFRMLQNRSLWNSLVAQTVKNLPRVQETSVQSLGSQRVRHDWVTNTNRTHRMFTGKSSKINYSVQFSHSVMSDSLRPHELLHNRPPCPSPTPGVHSNSCPLSQWCHPAIPSSVVSFSSCPQSLPALESFPMSQLFPWGGQSTGVTASESFLPKNTQDWSPLEWTNWISLQSKGLSRVFSNTTAQKHQFFDAQLSS